MFLERLEDRIVAASGRRVLRLAAGCLAADDLRRVIGRPRPPRDRSRNASCSARRGSRPRSGLRGVELESRGSSPSCADRCAPAPDSSASDRCPATRATKRSAKCRAMPDGSGSRRARTGGDAARRLLRRAARRGAARPRRGDRSPPPAMSLSTARSRGKRRGLQQRDLDGEPLLLGAAHDLVVPQQKVRAPQQLVVREATRRALRTARALPGRGARIDSSAPPRSAGGLRRYAEQVAVEQLEIAPVSAASSSASRTRGGSPSRDRSVDDAREEASRRRARGSRRRRRRESVRPLNATIWSSSESESRTLPSPRRAIDVERFLVGVDPFRRADLARAGRRAPRA